MIKKYDLSVLITARNEEFLARTVEGVLNARRGNTEVIVVLDGKLANPPIKDHEDVTILYHAESVGQRAGINDACALSDAKFIMKLDAHCIVDEGFDVKLMADCEYNWTVVPTLYNLHAFDWKCNKCGNRWYQGPTPKHCYSDDQGRTINKNCDSKEFERVMVWKPRLHKRTWHMLFDKDLKFGYWGAFKDREEGQGNISDTMSLLGACFFMHRKYFLETGGSDEAHGSWGQQGTEVACKAWLSGGRLVVNKNTWYSHLFRTQGGDFGFPYPQSGNQVEKARRHSRKMWKNKNWPLAKHNLSWLIEKFWPIPGWNQKDLDKLKKEEGMTVIKQPTKGIIYYTDNQLSLKIAHRCKNQIKSIGLPIVSTSLKPMDNMGKNIHIKRSRGYLTYFKQILTALEASTSDIIYFCEHDVLYHPSHFEFTPPKKDVYYYNTNFWRLRSTDGHCISYDTHQVNFICGYRDLLIKNYRERVKRLEALNTDDERIIGSEARKMGFEPGTHNRKERIDMNSAEKYQSKYPNIDIRHGANLTASRWHKEQFRDQRNCKDWKETTSDQIPGWDPSTLDFK